MDWGKDYFTFSDTNIEYIWRFLAILHESDSALVGSPLDRVVPALRHVDLGPRAPRPLRGSRDPSLYVRFPLARPRGRVDRRLDDDALDAAGERRRRRQSGRRLRAARERRVGRLCALPGGELHAGRQGIRARRPALRGAVRHARAGLAGRAPRDPVGRRRARHRYRHRPHRPRLRWRGLRAVEGARPRRAHAGRRERAGSIPSTAGCTVSRPARPPSRSSATSATAGCSCAPRPRSTATRSAGAVTRR